MAQLAQPRGAIPTKVLALIADKVDGIVFRMKHQQRSSEALADV